MATRPPPQTKAILATPLNVEESKAQRQQRSQARFRDRGGIFVPSNRNTLADILLGKAPPLTKPRKSVSASPSLRRQSKGRRSSPRKSNANILRRSESPVKQSRKSIKGGSREVVTIVESSTGRNVAAVSTNKQEKKQHPNTAARRSSIKKSKTAEADPLEDEEHDGHSNMNPDPSKKTGTKYKSSRKPMPNDVEAAPAVRKPKPKVKSASKDAALQEMEGPTQPKKAAGKRAPRPSAQPKAAASKASEPDSNASKTVYVSNVYNVPAAISSAIAGPSTSARPTRRKSGDLYSCGESEDEYVPKVSKKKQAPARTSSSSATAPAKKPVQSVLPAIVEEDEDQEGAIHTSSTLQRPLSVPNSKSKPEKALPSPPKPSSKAKTSKAGSSKSSSSKVPVVSDSGQKIKPKELKSGKSSSRKGKEVAADDDPLETAQKAGRAPSTKSNKRRADDIDPAEEEPEPPTKRPKSGSKTTQNAKATSGSKKALSKKRPRDIEDGDDDTAVEAKAAPAKKSAKRKKTADESDTDVPPPSRTKKGSAGGATKAKKKSAANDSGGAKKATKKSSNKAGQSEQTSSEKSSQPQAPVVKRGPPKSVLARIKASAKIHEVDNDPDEIDFLS